MKFEPSIKNEAIKPQWIKAPVKEATQECEFISDFAHNYNLQPAGILEKLDKYFSQDSLQEIINYLKEEYGIEDDSEILVEGTDTTADKILSKISDSDMKNIAKSAGLELTGKESSEELKGMVKAVASMNEAVNKRLKRLAKIESTTKLKRKKGIKGDLSSKFLN